MKQKIVIKVDMHCPKCRSKVMEIAAASHGVISVAIEGKEQDQVVVIGDEVDSTCLVKRLRKKVGWADIVTIEEVKPKQEKKEEKKVEKKDEKKEEKPRCQPQCHGYPYYEPRCQPQCHGYPYYVGYEIDEDEDPSPSICSIM